MANNGVTKIRIGSNKFRIEYPIDNFCTSEMPMTQNMIDNIPRKNSKPIET
jgi:hypothetical protein